MVQAGLLIAPGAEYFTVTRDSDRVGYASSTIDTSATRIHVSEFLLTEEPEGNAVRRMAVRGIVNLTRGMRLTDFRFDLGESYGPWSAVGSYSADSVLTVVTTAGAASRTRRAASCTASSCCRRRCRSRWCSSAARWWADTGPSRSTTRCATPSTTSRCTSAPSRSSSITDSATLDPSTDALDRREPGHGARVAHRDRRRRHRERLGGREGARRARRAASASSPLHRTAYEIAFQNWTLDNKEHPRAVVPPPAADERGRAAPRMTETAHRRDDRWNR